MAKYDRLVENVLLGILMTFAAVLIIAVVLALWFGVSS